MVYLRSVIDSPQHLRLALSQTAFFDQADPDEGGFALEVDEPVGGPIVLRVSGDLDMVTAPILGACLDEVVLRGRCAVIDLLPAGFVGCPALAVLADAGSRLRAQNSRLTVAALGPLRHILADAGIDAVQCFGTLVDAFNAALPRTAAVVVVVPPLRPRPGHPAAPRRRPFGARRPTPSIG
ncbi:STAS domain-containing protein (plasmid) [Rhodococcus sp. USK10]|uniref:STAS domain-containing protein n=1 Tax=Rhodococcus sp. USK10 TaxID=2789739 RepID=UPI001C5D9F97|nr:STAS domain-containing protein [Rhodococcus sp. USK10]QYA99897.1 STAS domain-containing protein [Rhodococcus sp. USK10]QYB00657.1 STAS domain-containing protein [Rhodococcus sp. USK10]